MTTVRRSEGGIDYLVAKLRETPRVVTQAIFWRIPHNDPSHEDVALKLGRYARRPGGAAGELEVGNPKSELTLTDGEFRNLISFLQENYEPFRAGERRYVPISGQLSDRDAEQLLRSILDNADTRRVVDLVVEAGLLPDEVAGALQFRRRQRALDEFRTKLAENLREYDWQRWFVTNDWVFGSDFVRVLDEREVDTANIADYFMQAYDGFLDIIEIKRPEGGLRFWADARDHGNFVPSTDLVKAVTQATNYLYEVEREANSVKFLERVGVRVVKPRATLIFGRSDGWGREHDEAYRILNRSYHDLTVLTYDHVLARAERILSGSGAGHGEQPSPDDGDFPF